MLSHSAGFDNDLTTSPEPRLQAGEFAYAGAGYLFLGEIIEQTTGQGFAEHMNSVVLPELGMTRSQFGVRATAPLALPSIDAGLPFAIMITITALVGAPLLFAHALAGRLWRSHRNRTWRLARHLIAIFAVGCGAFALRFIFGESNWATLLLTSSTLLALGSATWLLVTRKPVAARAAGAMCATLFVALLVVRPAVPLVERSAHFLPAAGLRTTASDYARFLAHFVEQAEHDAFWAQMLAPQARANAENDWGLGVGLQNGETPTVWHWGVNYPGYQALAIANRETGDVAVILMNGGQLSFSPSGFRYSGLETSRLAIAHIVGGRHGAYWQGIQ
jgi:CubicO group peptidase (beta-lactamase class C family)